MRVSALTAKAEYGVITHETLSEIFDVRMLTADLLSRSTDKQEAFMAKLTLHALSEVRKELEGRIV